MISWFDPVIQGGFSVRSTAPDLIGKLAERVCSGLLSGVWSWRNRYEIVKLGESQLKFRAASFLTGISIGLNDVTVTIERSTNTVQYEIRIWRWATFYLFCFAGTIIALGTFVAIHFTDFHYSPEFRFLSDIDFLMYLVPVLICWAFIRPLIFIQSHKRTIAERLEQVIREVNVDEKLLESRKRTGWYQTYLYWQGKLFTILIFAIILTACKLVHRRWKFGESHIGYSYGTQPDEYLSRSQEPALGVDVRTETPDDFPEFLGKGRNCAVDHVELEPDWTTHPPNQLWRQPIGGGWSAFAIVNGFAVTMEQRGPNEQVTCYAVNSGRHHWTVAWEARFSIFGECPRSTPAIADGKVFALGSWGHLTCIDGNSGAVLWERELLNELGIDWKQESRSIQYGRSNSPLVTGGLVIIPGGGKLTDCSSLLAYDVKTGELRWRGGKRNISYSSPILTKLLGEDQILTVNEDTVSGHSPLTGAELWYHPWNGNSNVDANVSQPVVLPGNRILLSKGYGHGAAVIELSRKNSDHKIQITEVWRNRAVLRTKFTNVVLWNEHIYGLSDGRLECVEIESGKRCWREGRYGNGQILRVGTLLLVLSEKGRLSLIELSSSVPNKVLGSIQVLKGLTWNNIALYGNILLVRNSKEAACYELQEAMGSGK